MMISVAINKNWFEEIKASVPHKDPYFYNDLTFGEMVEVDVDEMLFNEVSKIMGWM